MNGMGTPSGIPEQPVLVIGPCGDEVTELCNAMRADGWTLLIAEDVDRARWLASIQRVALILIAGGPGEREVANAIRPVSNAPLVVLGDPAPQSVISLVEAGVDAVIDPRAGDDDVRARLGALLRRMDRAFRSRRPLPAGRWVGRRSSRPGVRARRSGAGTLPDRVRRADPPHDPTARGPAGADDRAPGLGLERSGRSERVYGSS